MIRYAVSITDLELAWKTPAGVALLESALDGDEKPQTVAAEPGVEACVLAGAEEIVESVASGLLCFDLPLTPPRRTRVYARAKGERRWTRLHDAQDVPYAPGQSSDTGSPRVDPEFLELAAPMDEATRAALRASLVEEGCRDALVVWAEKDVLLDGHNRLALCRELGIPFTTTKLSFPDRTSALAWFVASQRTRRSLTPHWASYYLGRKYLEQNPGHGGARARGQSAHSMNPTARGLGTISGVDERTVRRAAAWAEAVDALEAAIPHARRAVLNREIKLSRRQIEQAIEDCARSLDDLRELTEPSERDYLAEVLHWARKLRDSLDAYRVRGSQPSDRERVAQAKPAIRSALAELPLLLDELRADVGLSADDDASAELAEAAHV